MRGFAFTLLLVRIGGLRLIGITNLFDGMMVVALSAYIGSWLDRHDRKRGAVILLWLNALGVALVAGTLVALLTVDPGGIQKESHESHSHSSAETSAETTDAPELPIHILRPLGLVLVVALSAVVRCTNASLHYIYSADWLIVLAEREIASTSLAGRCLLGPHRSHIRTV